jgi:glucosyl-3-phosphoglycerate phosphatase
MPEVVLVRHAPTSWSGRRYCGRADPPLTEAGEALAERLAAELAARFAPGVSGPSPGTVRIVSSPAARARQTAGAIADMMPGAAVEIDDRWAEVDVGIAEGLSFDELGVIAPDLAARLANGDAAIDWPGGESADALAERVSAAWRDLLQGTLPTIVVSHAGPLRVAAALATDAPTEDVPFLEPGAFLRVPRSIGS